MLLPNLGSRGQLLGISSARIATSIAIHDGCPKALKREAEEERKIVSRSILLQWMYIQVG